MQELTKLHPDHRVIGYDNFCTEAQQVFAFFGRPVDMNRRSNGRCRNVGFNKPLVLGILNKEEFLFGQTHLVPVVHLRVLPHSTPYVTVSKSYGVPSANEDGQIIDKPIKNIFS